MKKSRRIKKAAPKSSYTRKAKPKEQEKIILEEEQDPKIFSQQDLNEAIKRAQDMLVQEILRGQQKDNPAPAQMGESISLDGAEPRTYEWRPQATLRPFTLKEVRKSFQGLQEELEDLGRALSRLHQDISGGTVRQDSFTPEAKAPGLLGDCQALSEGIWNQMKHLKQWALALEGKVGAGK